MKAVLLPLLAALALIPPAFAGKGPDKDPEKMAKETREISESLVKETKYLEEKAASLAGKDAAAVSRFAKITRSEAESLAKASEAWSKNQIRLAEKHMKDAAEYCSDRGKLAEDLKEVLADPKKDENCEPKKEEHKKPEPTKVKSTSPSNEVEKLQEQISQLGKPSE